MLKVTGFAGRDKHGRYLWRCSCSCGEHSVVKATYLVNGVTKSCGCHKRSGLHRTHGQSGTKTYEAWKALRQRCTNPNRPQWNDWGGRGISFDPAWGDYDAFLRDMREAPPGGMLERIDNNGPYCKANCKWATRQEQNSNKRNVRLIEHNGERRTLPDWARHLGIPTVTLVYRFRRGWAVERALTAGRHHRFGKFAPSDKA